ncbi:TPA: head-tail adaptor protein [Serratia marcescens]
MSVKPLDPGELKTRVQFGYLEPAEGQMSEPLPGKFIAAGKAWVKAEPISHRKIRTADQAPVVETWQFTTFPRADVAGDWKVIANGISYTVRTVDRSESDRVVITAEVDPAHDRVSY